MEILLDPKFFLVGTATFAWAGLLVLWRNDSSTLFVHGGLLAVIGWIIEMDPGHPVVFALGSWLLQVGFFLWYASVSVGRRLHGRGQVHPPLRLMGAGLVVIALLLQTLHLVGVEDPARVSWETLDRVFPYWFLLAIFHLLGGQIFGLGLVQAITAASKKKRLEQAARMGP